MSRSRPVQESFWLFFKTVLASSWTSGQMSLWKNRPKCGPIHSLSKLMHNLNRETKEPKNVGYFYNVWKTVQRKHSPIGQNFAQSGHPDYESYWVQHYCHNLRYNELAQMVDSWSEILCPSGPILTTTKLRTDFCRRGLVVLLINNRWFESRPRIRFYLGPEFPDGLFSNQKS
jgi:hypothetical protein